MTDAEKARIQNVGERARLDLDAHFSDIDRIGEFGPQPDDEILVRKVFLWLSGEMYMKRAELRELESGCE